MKAALEGRAGSQLKILAVTVLTSYDNNDLQAAGYRHGVSELVETRARQAQEIGVDGLVCSAEEAASLRKVVGDQLRLVTPGIRPAGASTGDQKRIMTPSRAITAGADYLVVGRPILEAADPKGAAEVIVTEIAQASVR
jgi:orotidine-5'-phosphate decarboxylase